MVPTNIYQRAASPFLRLSLLLPLVLGILLGGCAWQRVPNPPPAPAISTIPLRVGVELSDSPASQFYGPRVVGLLNEAHIFSQLVYPTRPEDPLDAVLSLSLDGAWRPRTGASFWSGFAIGLTFGALSPVLGPSMNGVHDVTARLSSGQRELTRYQTQVSTRVSWGILGNTGEVGAKADDLQVRKIAFGIANHLQAARASIERAPASGAPSQLPEPAIQALPARERGSSLADELRKLDELHQSGALTEAEFQKAKARLLQQ